MDYSRYEGLRSELELIRECLSAGGRDSHPPIYVQLLDGVGYPAPSRPMWEAFIGANRGAALTNAQDWEDWGVFPRRSDVPPFVRVWK